MEAVAMDEKTEFKFSELSEKAKQTARDNYIQGVEFDAEHTIADAAHCLGFLGIEIDDRQFRTYGGSTRSEPDVYYNAGWGHHWVAFNGTWRAEQMDVAGLLDYAGGDEVKKLGAQGMALFLRYPQAKAYIKRSLKGESMGVERVYVTPDTDTDDEVNDEAQTYIADFLEHVEGWFCNQLVAEYDWQMDDDRADEYYDESAGGEDILFDEDGERV
jgi:hypothetical protein